MLLSDVMISHFTNLSFEENSREALSHKFVIPDIHSDLVQSSLFGARYTKGSYLIKTHFDFLSISQLIDLACPVLSKSVVLFRRPEDALISYYFLLKRKASTQHLERDIDKFVLTNLKKWYTYYHSYLEARRIGKPILFVSYESLKGDTFKSLGQILNFIFPDYVFDDQKVISAVERCQFARILKWQSSHTYKKKKLNDFFRSGSSNQGSIHLTENTLEYIRKKTETIYSEMSL